MTIAAFAILFSIAIGLALIAVVNAERERKTRQRVHTLIRSEDNLDIIGDGAWRIPAAWPKHSARVRDIEPWGA